VTLSCYVTVHCPFCRRPLCQLFSEGTHDHVRIIGVVKAENRDPSGTLTSYEGGPIRRWAGEVLSSDPSLVPGSSSGVGRKTLVCNGRHRHQLSWPVTQAALDATYWRALAAGRTGVSADEIHD
jgi:hypothetical protein